MERDRSSGQRLADRRESSGPRPRPTIPLVIAQHVEVAGMLWRQRHQLAASGHLRLHQLNRFDERLAAHLDGIAVAGDEGWSACEAALAECVPGGLFTAAVIALDSRQSKRIERILADKLAEGQPDEELIAAFEWLDGDRLRGIVTELLSSPIAARRLIGTAACAAHRVDPGIVAAIQAPQTSLALRACQLRTAGTLGRDEMAFAVASMVAEQDPECSNWAAWAAVILGDRGAALKALTDNAATIPGHASRPLELSLQAQPRMEAHRLLEQLGSDPARQRSLVRGAGVVGDPAYVPWLTGRMEIEAIARAAGEAFALMTGVDLALLDLERKPPDDVTTGPTDDPDEPDVDMDPDEGLPWPDAQRIETWWTDNSSRFESGTRYFMGLPVTREHCLDVLKTGYQRQRTLAAQYLCLLDPGTPLFNTAAPAWRQLRELALM